MSFAVVPLDDFKTNFSATVELSSVALGGRICSVSDEFFAEAANLLKVEPAPSLKGQFGPRGALYSGWESRRHNPDFDWCIVKLGCAGSVIGFDVDTAHFNGNEAPEVSVEALLSMDVDDPEHRDQRWTEILPRIPLGPNSRHLFKIAATASVNFVKLCMYPDGGIARFRVYGHVNPVFPLDETQSLDLAHVFAGGLAVIMSDQHFGVGSNLLLPGRGKDMGDGWETKRSRQPNHKDWVIIKLGHPGYLSMTEIDTAHFKGNFPESCELHAIMSEETAPQVPDDSWIPILSRTTLGPHTRHFFQLENVAGRKYTHVRLTIYPDGGVKRVRVIGTRAPPTAGKGTGTASESELPSQDEISQSVSADKKGIREDPPIPAVALTAAAFAPFGNVVQAWSDEDGVPKGVKVTSANFGSATKFHKLAPLVSSYRLDSGATTGISVYRCKPAEIASDKVFEVKVLERHPFTNQAFIPMGAAPHTSEDSLGGAGTRYLVIVAQSSEDGSPELTRLRAFVANAGQGIVYHTGVWHHPMVALDTIMDFSCIETQIGNGAKADCEILQLETEKCISTVQL